MWMWNGLDHFYSCPWGNILRIWFFWGMLQAYNEMNYFMTIGDLAHGLPPLYAEIGEVVAGLKPGRQNDEEMIFDMNIGMGVVDIVVARDIVQRAIKETIGTRLAL